MICLNNDFFKNLQKAKNGNFAISLSFSQKLKFIPTNFSFQIFWYYFCLLLLSSLKFMSIFILNNFCKNIEYYSTTKY